MKNIFNINKFSMIMRIFMFAGTLSGTKAVMTPAETVHEHIVIKSFYRFRTFCKTVNIKTRCNSMAVIARKSLTMCSPNQEEKKFFQTRKSAKTGPDPLFLTAQNIDDQQIYTVYDCQKILVDKPDKPIYPYCYEYAAQFDGYAV